MKDLPLASRPLIHGSPDAKLSLDRFAQECFTYKINRDAIYPISFFIAGMLLMAMLFQQFF